MPSFDPASYTPPKIPWLPELTNLAKLGITAMVTDVPLKVTGDPSADSAGVIATVLAHRRALDLLGRREDADPSPELVSATVGTKQRKDYDAGADLVGSAPAATDRQAFLRKVLRVK